MKLYFDPITVNCRKVVAGLDMVGASYDSEHVDYFGGGHKEPAFHEINPNEELPALTDDDLVLWESNAILVYGAEKAGNTSAYPQDAKIRADIQRWLLWESSKWFGACYVYLVENVVKPMLDGTPDNTVLEGNAATFHKLATILEERLVGRDWLSALPCWQKSDPAPHIPAELIAKLVA
jgi:glutathione S-transferase